MASSWRLYYDDGSTFEGDWQAAPAWGVQAVVVSYPDHQGVILCGDFYFTPPHASVPYAGDMWGVVDLLIHRGVMGVDDRLIDFPASVLIDHGVKFGRMMDRDAYLRLKDKIVAVTRRNPNGTVALDTRETGQPWEVNA